ncbi:MAG: hypothetical protein JRI23_27790 [Deltaproteobacteria bacterium]|jgi:hypothetical protein|nr:hypothetical protein [Deltaproteobacteria bacterium]MBW2535891.1 hypothetical protein [Deltaproteobacteria bacterium]
MPLAFRSITHGTIAFGFFNIETDMLLLEQLFFFADRFCAAMVELARGGADGEAAVDGWRIAQPEAVGNLHGAIAGVDLSGFIGATYREFPFPARPEDFKQSPSGSRTQPWVAETVAGFGTAERVDVRLTDDRGGVRIGEYGFDAEGARALVAYVERGGYPRYRDERRPAYVEEMMRELRAAASRWAS